MPVRWWRCRSCGTTYSDASGPHVCGPVWDPDTHAFPEHPNPRNENQDPTVRVRELKPNTFGRPHQITAEGLGREQLAGPPPPATPGAPDKTRQYP